MSTQIFVEIQTDTDQPGVKRYAYVSLTEPGTTTFISAWWPTYGDNIPTQRNVLLYRDRTVMWASRAELAPLLFPDSPTPDPEPDPLPIQWASFLAQDPIEWGDDDGGYRTLARCAADMWDTCAIGEARLTYPGIVRCRESDDAPLDRRLFDLGREFGDAISRRQTTSARMVYRQIQARVQELIWHADNPEQTFNG